jgi:molybdopterin biosynthesis enzyme
MKKQRSERMASYQEALEMLLKNITALEVEEKRLLESIGQVSAENVRAGRGCGKAR